MKLREMESGNSLLIPCQIPLPSPSHLRVTIELGTITNLTYS